MKRLVAIVSGMDKLLFFFVKAYNLYILYRRITTGIAHKYSTHIVSCTKNPQTYLIRWEHRVILTFI